MLSVCAVNLLASQLLFYVGESFHFSVYLYKSVLGRLQIT